MSHEFHRSEVFKKTTLKGTKVFPISNLTFRTVLKIPFNSLFNLRRIFHEIILSVRLRTPFKCQKTICWESFWCLSTNIYSNGEIQIIWTTLAAVLHKFCHRKTSHRTHMRSKWPFHFHSITIHALWCMKFFSLIQSWLMIFWCLML